MCSANLGPGWNISSEGFKIISENNSITERNILLRNSLNADLKEIGSPVLKTELAKNQISSLVLQIQKIRNVSAPKANEDSQGAPRMLKLILTDGENYAPAIEFSNISSISRERTPPGTKILLNKVKILSGFLILNNDNTTLLGGTVPHLFDKWELAKSVQHNSRPTVVSDGPPSWVDFGCEILSSGGEIKEVTNKSKDQTKDSSEFEVLRQGAIAEATTGAVRKVFGGCAKKFVQDDQKIEHKHKTESGKGYTKNKKELKSNREDTAVKLQKPSDKVSLFDFLENKLNITESISDNQEKSLESSKDSNSRFTQEYKKNNYKTYPNKKSNLQKNDNYSYNERNYDSPRDSRKDYTFKNDSNRNHFNSNSGEYIKDKGKNIQIVEKDSNKNIPKDLPNKGIHSHNEKLNETWNHTTNKYNSTKEHRFTKDSNSLRNNFNISEDNSTSSNRTYPKIGSNESYNHFNKSPRYPGNEEKKINDSWHYRAPEKSNNLNQPLGVHVDYVTENLNKMAINSNFASRSLRQHLNLNAKNSSSLPPQKISHNDKNDDHKEWNIGDECLAKYWEDEKFYPARITASTATTFVVQFKGYGNIEEILKTDCMSLRRREKGDKRQHQGTLEFRRNQEKPRPR